MWDAETGRERVALRGHRGAVASIAFSADDRLLLTTADDGAARLWDAADGASLGVQQVGAPNERRALWRFDGAAAPTPGGRSWSAGFIAADDAVFLSGRELSHWRYGERRRIAFLQGDEIASTGLARFQLATEISTAHHHAPMRAADLEAARFFEERLIFGRDALAAHARRVAPRCLRAWELRDLLARDAPPRWCVTGPDAEAEPDPKLWAPKPPYEDPAWRDWLIARDRGETPAPPRIDTPRAEAPCDALNHCAAARSGVTLLRAPGVLIRRVRIGPPL